MATYVVLYKPEAPKLPRGETLEASAQLRATALVREAAVLGVETIHVHTAAFPGFSARLTPAQRRVLEADASVAAVVPNFRLSCYGVRLDPVEAQAVAAATPALAKAYQVQLAPLPEADAKDQVKDDSAFDKKLKTPQLAAARVVSSPASTTVPWNVQRVRGCATNRNTCSLASPAAQEVKGVRVYVVDTGVGTHASLRVDERRAFVSSEPGVEDDLNGHGTHVAGTLAGYRQLFGVAGGARLIAVRVLDRNGGGTFADVIAGLDSIARDRITFPRTPMVLNLSLGADTGSRRYTPLDVAIQRLVSRNVHCVVAAGNDGIDAATVTPAHVREAITVGAYGANNRIAGFSNFGPSLHLLAPGVDILSTWPNDRFAQLSGTSMATPHVTGAVALYLAAKPASTPTATKQAVLRASERAPAATNPRITIAPRRNTTTVSLCCVGL
jgi:subtilisin family serine protease